MATIRAMVDPITNKRYDYMTTSEREDHLYGVLVAANANQCPPDRADYLCEQDEAIEGSELIQCAVCYRRWAGKVGGADSQKAQRLEAAIELAINDKCPPDQKDMLCQATEDEDTSEETCAKCLERWATIPFAKFKN